MCNNVNSVNPYIIFCGYINESNCPKPGWDYGVRVVRWFEVELILWGKGFIETEGEKIATQKGRIFFRRPGMVVRGVAPYYCYRIVFDMKYDPSLLAEYERRPKKDNLSNEGSVKTTIEALEYFGFKFPDFFDTLQVEKYQELFQKIYNCYIKSERYEQFVMKTYLQLILLYAYNEYSIDKSINFSRSIKMNYPKVMNAKKYIDNNFNKQISLKELGNISGLSPNFLCKIFRDIIGETPITYMNKFRINIAKKKLIETDKTVKIIALECGFENYSYFFTLFRNQTGMTPLEYRESNSFS